MSNNSSLEDLLKERKKLLRQMSEVRNSGGSWSGLKVRIIEIEKEINELSSDKVKSEE